MNANLQPDPAAFWICQLPGMTSTLLLQLLGAFGPAAAILRASSRDLRAQGVGPALIAKIVAGARDVPHVAAGLKGLQRLGIVPLPLAAPTYPRRLLDLQQPPMVVYVLGTWPVREPLALVMQPPAVGADVAVAWSELASQAQPQFGLAGLEAEVAPGVVPRVLGVPFGLMLARQRLAPAVWQQVAQGTTTLLATAPPTAQPLSAAAAAALPSLVDTLVALAAALVLVAPPTAQADACLQAAAALGVPPFLFGQAQSAPLPPGVRRLRPGKAGLRSLAATLGVKVSGAYTVQQERLF